MKTAARPLEAAVLADLRTPLSRVALAAGQLARTDMVPAQRRLLDVIAEAVEDLDTRIGRRLRVVLAAEHSLSGPPADADAILGELHERLEGVLFSCGVRWTADFHTGVRLRADPHLVRRAAVALLRAVTRALTGGGALELRPVRSRDRGGLELRLAPDSAEEPAVCDDEGLSSFAAAHQLQVRAFRSAGSLRTVLWLAPEEQAA